MAESERWPAIAWLLLALSVIAAGALALSMLGVNGPWPPVALAAILVAAGLAVANLRRTRVGDVQAENLEMRAAMAESERDGLQHELRRHDALEQELLKAKQAAESAVLAKGEFLATMSHEIRTPLNGIIPMLDMLSKASLSADQRELLNTASTSSQQLLRIVDDILDYSKLEANKLELEVTTFNLRELIDGVLQLMQRPAESKGLRLILQLDPAVRLSVRGDPIRLRQVLSNLIGNAVKFTERGSITLAIRRLGENAAQHQLRFEVRDTGIGIDPAAQARLFNSFSQADASTTRLYGGTGLGLAICKRIIDLMGGRIGVVSEPGQGSTFWFETPLLKTIGDMRTRETAFAQSGRILLVTPDSRLQQRVSMLLSNWGFHVQAVGTTHEALDRLRMTTDHGMTGYMAVLADLSGIRTTARALHRAVARHEGESSGDLRLVWLYGDDTVPEELHPGATLLSRQAPDAELRAALTGTVSPSSSAATNTPATITSTDFATEAPPTRFPAAQPESSSLPAVAAPSSGRILLVEDNPVNLLVARKLLDSLSFEYDTATNGAEALAMLTEDRYGLVLMDCQMPVLDGYSAARRWREQEARAATPRRLPIVAMTANAMAGDRQKCLDAGMDDYLSKPVSRELLEACLQRWLPGNTTFVLRNPAAAPPPSAPLATAIPAAPNPPVLDRSALDELREIAGDETSRIVTLFLEDAPRLITRLEAGAIGPDLAVMRDAAHTLKSSSANIGAMALSAAAKRVELGARAMKIEQPAVAVALVIAEYARARIALQGFLAGIANTPDTTGQPREHSRN